MLVHYGAKFQGRAPARAGALFPLAQEEQAYLEAHVWSPAPSTQRIHVPNNKVLGIWGIVTRVQVWGKYMIIMYLDP